jgi:phosphonatase-like hydrolase
MSRPPPPSEERIRAITREVLRELGSFDGAPPKERRDDLLLEPPRGTGSQGVRLVVFDMAGTTLRDDDNVLTCMMRSVEKHRLAATAEEVNAFMGVSKRHVFQHFVRRQYGSDPRADQILEAAYADFQRTLEDSYRNGPVEAIPGAEDTFRWLTARGIRVATTTGFYRKVTDILLARLGWDRGLVDASISVDEVPKGRPAPFMVFSAMARLGVESVHQVIKVGDTPFDMLEGHNAGVRGIVGVLTGAHGAESFGRVRHTHILPSVRELPELIESEF